MTDLWLWIRNLRAHPLTHQSLYSKKVWKIGSDLLLIQHKLLFHGRIVVAWQKI